MGVKNNTKAAGFLLIDKPIGWTSFDVCAKLRRQLNIKRVGHTGTLDPFATGLLVVAFGKATKLIPLLDKAHKTYRATIAIGKTSETLDTESEIKILTNDFVLEKAAVELIMKRHFTGEIQQTPPKYSALKINGKKMCDLVRSGQEVFVRPRLATVLDWKILNVDNSNKTIDLELTVAAGFYVRSFARDLGQKIAKGGVCIALRRIAVGDLSVSSATMVQESLTIDKLVDPKNVLTKAKKVFILEERVADFTAGRAFPIDMGFDNGTKLLVVQKNKTIGMAEIVDDKLQPRVVF